MSTPLVVLLLIVTVLSVGEFLLFGALAEAYRDIRQLREQGGILDRPVPVDLGDAAGAPPSSIGLPATLDTVVAALALYVDHRCTTCRGLMASLAGRLPDGVFLTAIAPSQAEAMKWLVHAGGFDVNDSTVFPRIAIVSPDELRRRLGTEITPLAIDIEHGRLVRASTVPSVRQFYNRLPNGYRLPIHQTQGAPT